MKTVAVVLTNAMHGMPVLNELTVPLYGAANVKPPWVEADDLANLATDGPVDPHPYVGEYESVTTAYRVVPHERGLALHVRQKMRFYDGDTVDELPPAPLRPIRDAHFIGSHGFVTFINPGADGRMQHLISGPGRLYRRRR